MTSPSKENLVLVNAFLTNSLVLRGLIDYLGNYFRVHFIDLPGFVRDIPRQPCRFQDLPYVLILSHSDKTIKNGPLLELFEKKIDRLKVVLAGFDHYPLEVSEDYFQSRFPQEDIHDIIVFFGGRSPTSFS